MSITPLDLAWEAINALAGVPSTEAEADYCRAINDALDQIEALGGEDPAPKRSKASHCERCNGTGTMAAGA